MVRKTISCFTLPEPSDHNTMQAVGRKRGLQGLALCRLVWKLDQSAIEALQDAHECLWSQNTGRIVVWGFFWMLSSMGDGHRLLVVNLLWAHEVRGTFSVLSSCSFPGPGCMSVGLGAA